MSSFRVTIALLVLAAIPASADWQSIGPSGGPIGYVASSRTQPQVVYATSGYNPFELLRSDDQGDNWNRVGSCSGYAYCLETSASDVLFAGGYAAIYRSTDGGHTWTTKSLPNTYIYAMAVHPTDPSTVYGSGYTSTGSIAFLKTTDGGESWSVSTIAAGYGRCIAVSESSPSTIFVGGYVYSGSSTPLLYRSTNGGGNWSLVTPPGASSDYYMHS
ncbi:hypothetical protein JW921_04035, partial [Candidatus Fermentibacterales bacterium]|nr:hypothetical protein [Candidatus Fermentibacterales bacterium]